MTLTADPPAPAVPAPAPTLPDAVNRLAALLCPDRLERLVAPTLAALDPYLRNGPTGGADTALITVDDAARLIAIYGPHHTLIADVLTIFRPWLIPARLTPTARRPTNPPPTAAAVATEDTDTDTDVALTARELDVLHLLAEGLTNPAIGRRLYLSQDTVKTYMRKIFRKLGAANRTQAVLRAQQARLLPRP